MKHEIRPHRTSGVQPAVSTPARPVGAPVRRAPVDNVLSVAQRRTAARHWGDLIEPALRGDAVTVRLDGHEHGLPAGVELAPGDGVVYVQYRGRLFVLVPSAEGIRQLDVDRDLADRIRQTHFQK